MRKLRRHIAMAKMKKLGMRKICKHDHSQCYSISGKKGEVAYVQSYFAKHWREYV